MKSDRIQNGDYYGFATTKFNELKKLYANNDKITEKVDFWKLGNSFDTMIDFLDTIDSRSADDVGQMATKQFKISIQKLGGYDEAWFDDFGWWSIAAQRALQKSFFKDYQGEFAHILKECWPRFTDNAPFVWERRKAGSFDKCAPAVKGGVWNVYWEGTSSEWPGPKSGDPTAATLLGIQNTVTNGLFLMAAQRLENAFPGASEAAGEERQFLLAWLDEKEGSLWMELDDNAGLVRERVGYFANGSRAPGFQKEWAWAGDQGLILGALSDAMLQLPPGGWRDGYHVLATKILKGARMRLVNDKGILRSYTKEGSVPDGDQRDYRTGEGVFWRHVLHVWKTNDDLRSILAAPEFRSILRASADAAEQPVIGEEIDMLTNQIAVLVAASAILE